MAMPRRGAILPRWRPATARRRASVWSGRWPKYPPIFPWRMPAPGPLRAPFGLLPRRLLFQASSSPHCGTFLGTMASRSVNKVILLGHLGKDAETKFTPSGISKSTFSIATNRRWKDQQSGEWKEETDWHNIVLWRSENLANFLLKGKQVYLEGRLQSRSYEDKDGQKKYITEVVADELILLGGRGDSG